MSTTFHVPENGASTTVASGGRSSGSPTLNVVNGSGFGTVYPKLLTVARAGAVLCILEATARTSNAFTISGAVDGTSDVSMVAGDVVEIRPTKLSQTELQDAVNNLETITEVAVTGAITLTSSAYGKYHACSGTSANYAVTLPTAVGFAGQTIGFRMAPGLTKLVTLDGNGSETIAGALTRVMWAGETAVLESDGTNWVRLGSGSIPMIGRLRLSASAVMHAAVNLVALDATEVDNTAMMADLANSQLVIPRASLYDVNGTVVFSNLQSGNLARLRSQVMLNGTQVFGGEVSALVGAYVSVISLGLQLFAAGDLITLTSYQASGVDQTAYGSTGDDACRLTVKEVILW